MRHDPALELFRAEVSRIIVQELKRRRRFPLGGMRIADVGCGFGFWLSRYREWGASDFDLFGIDLNPDRAFIATQTCGGCNVQVADVRRLPFRSSYFDIVSQFTLLSSTMGIEDRVCIAREMMRVLRPGGLILSYDFFAPNLLNPRTRRLGQGEIHNLFPNSMIALRRTTLAPPLARAAIRLSNRLANGLASISLLKTHYVAFIEPRVDHQNSG